MHLVSVAFVSHLLTAGLTGQPSLKAAPSCPPQGMERADLLRLKEAKFQVPSLADRNRLAIQLLSCLDDPDPKIRDGVVFEGLSTWLRAKSLSSETVLALEDSLQATLRGDKDARGFRLPFAALLLSEVARVDRIEPVFTDEVRASLVELAASSLTRVSDYRGFDAVEGWRHGVAHGSDLVLQLGLNAKVTGPGLSRMMDAVATQIAPRGAVFYTFGEPERLARAVTFAYRRGVLDPGFWDTWFAAIADPRPLSTWGAAFESVDGLARRHNTVAFLQALSFGARALHDEASKSLAEKADKALTQIMGG